MKPTVAIIGSHPRTRAEFDFSRTDCDIWLFNEAMSNPANTWAKRADAVFQMHEEAIWRNPRNRNDPKHYEWLSTQGSVDVYMQEQYADVPKSEAYPLDALCENLLKDITVYIDGKPREFKYFSNSVDYALALAAHLHKAYGMYERVEVYGVEMETNTEYTYQRTGVAYWIGYLSGMGLKVDVHNSIFDMPLYGYEGEVTFPPSKFDDRIAELTPQVEQLTKEYYAATQNINLALTAFQAEASKDAENNLFTAIMKQAQLGEQLGIADGMKQENEKYKAKADTMKEASGEFLFSRQEFESAAKTLSDEVGKAHTDFVAVGTKLAIVQDNIKKSAKGSPKRHAHLQAFVKVLQEYLNAVQKEAVYKGASMENFQIMAWMDKHIRAAGGSKSEAVLLERLQAQDVR
jgi:hypothetical protein